MSKFNNLLKRAPSFFTGHAGLWLFALSLFSLGLYLVVWHLAPAFGRDSARYLLMIQQWYETGTKEATWYPPMLCCMVRGVMALGVSAAVAGLAVNMLSGALLVPTVAAIAFEATQNKKIMLVAALFTALHPSVVALSTEVQRDMPYLLLAAFSFWFALAAAKRKKWFFWCGAGVCLALAAFSRFESAELIPLFLSAILVLTICKHLTWRQGIGYACCLMLSAFVSLFLFLFLYSSWGMGERYETYFMGKLKRVEQQQFMHFFHNEKR